MPKLVELGQRCPHLELVELGALDGGPQSTVSMLEGVDGGPDFLSRYSPSDALDDYMMSSDYWAGIVRKEPAEHTKELLSFMESEAQAMLEAEDCRLKSKCDELGIELSSIPVAGKQKQPSKADIIAAVIAATARNQKQLLVRNIDI
jgi:hypothetical protein